LKRFAKKMMFQSYAFDGVAVVNNTLFVFRRSFKNDINVHLAARLDPQEAIPSKLDAPRPSENENMESNYFVMNDMATDEPVFAFGGCIVGMRKTKHCCGVLNVQNTNHPTYIETSYDGRYSNRYDGFSSTKNLSDLHVEWKPHPRLFLTAFVQYHDYFGTVHHQDTKQYELDDAQGYKYGDNCYGETLMYQHQQEQILLYQQHHRTIAQQIVLFHNHSHSIVYRQGKLEYLKKQKENGPFCFQRVVTIADSPVLFEKVDMKSVKTSIALCSDTEHPVRDRMSVSEDRLRPDDFAERDDAQDKWLYVYCMFSFDGQSTIFFAVKVHLGKNNEEEEEESARGHALATLLSSEHVPSVVLANKKLLEFEQPEMYVCFKARRLVLVSVPNQKIIINRLPV